jgi:hypothetical protein
MPHSTTELAGMVFPGQRADLWHWGVDVATANGADLSGFFDTVVVISYLVDSGWVGPPTNGVVLHHEDPNLVEVGFSCHELGHAYGLPHSFSANPDMEYGDAWDLMSWQTSAFPFEIDYGGASGLADVGLNTRNLDALGALPHNRIWTPAAPDFSDTIVLDPLCQYPLGATNLLVVQIQPGSTRPARPSGYSYCAEYRTPAGWDQGIPQDSITIRERRGTSPNDLSYLQPTRNSSFLPGQTYETPDPPVFINVESIDPAAKTARLRVWDIPDQALRKEDSNPAVYLIRNGGKALVESPDVLTQILGRAWGDVRLVPDGGLASVPAGVPLVPFWGHGRLFSGAFADGSLVAYDGVTMDWWLASWDGSVLNWAQAANSSPLGQLGDGRPIWAGEFTGSGHTDLLFYFPVNGDWFVGTISGSQLSWGNVGNTHGFGDTSHDPTWIGSFSGPGQDEVLFYSPGDFKWWLGTINGGQLSWADVGDTHGFGQVADGRPFWTGDFTGQGRTEILFFYPGGAQDRVWWLGTINAGTLTWANVGNTAGFGDTSHDPTWIGSFSGPGQDEVLFYSPGDYNWWLGRHTAGNMHWSLVGQGVAPGAVHGGL